MRQMLPTATRANRAIAPQWRAKRQIALAATRAPDGYLRSSSFVATVRIFEGIGVVVAVDPRKNRLVLTHGEIKGFMAAMVEMSFMVTRATLLKGFEPGDKVRFSIDADKRAIVDVVPLDR